MNQLIPVFILVLSLLPALNAWAQSDKQPSNLSAIFRSMDISMEGADKFVVTKDFSRGAGKKSSRSISAKSGDNFIKIEATVVQDEKESSKNVEEKTKIIRSLYNRIPSAYPGALSNTIEIPDEYKPVSKNLNDDPARPVMLLYTTARFTYGASTEDLIKYRSALMFKYCSQSNTLYRIEYFSPKESFDETNTLATLSTFECNPAGPTSASIKENRTFDASYQCKDCNVIFIGWEPLGANHLNLYGYEKKTSPQLDRFAQESIVFRNAISVSSWTLPAFMSMFTSLYPSQHRLVNKFSAYTENIKELSNLKKLSPGTVTLAQALKQNGYVTGGFTGGAAVGIEFGYDLGFDRYDDDYVFGGFDDVFPRALKWIKKNKDRKFFAFILGYDVHGRYPLPADHTKQFMDADYSGKYKGTAEEYWKLRDDSIDVGHLDLTEDDIKFWRDWYDTKIFESDKRFGEFLDQLSKTIDLEKTVFVITSASGNEFYEHKIFDHGHGLYEELIRVPLVFHIPHQKPIQVAEQVRIIDIMPTLLEVLAITPEENVTNQMRGVSLVNLMKGEHKDLFAFSETDYLLQSFKRSVRSPDGWKFIYSMDSEERELYNILSDPLEQNNVINEEPAVAYQLEQKLFDWLENMGQDDQSHNRLIEGVISSP